MAEWDAEIVVGIDLARALIREQFPALGRTIEPFGAGWDNTAYLVDGDLVFRFPRRRIAARLMEAETRVLPRLTGRLPIAIPNPRWAGAPTEAFPWPFSGYRRLHGRTVDSVDLPDAARRAMAAPLGAFLRALHDVSPDGLGLPDDELRRTDFGQRISMLTERIGVLEDAGLIENRTRWLRLFESDDFPAPAERTVPVHGDLYERHLLVDEAHRACGVIDWGDVHAGDPGIDLSLLYRFFPAAARDGFLRVYGDIDARTARMARLRAAFHAVSLTFFAHTTGDAPLLRAGLTALRYVLEG